MAEHTSMNKPVSWMVESPSGGLYCLSAAKGWHVETIASIAVESHPPLAVPNKHELNKVRLEWFKRGREATLRANPSGCVCRFSETEELVITSLCEAHKELMAASERELTVARKLFWLAANDCVFFAPSDKQDDAHDYGAYPAINCNDVFVPGADALALYLRDLDAFIAVCKVYPTYGPIAWCIIKRAQKLWQGFPEAESIVPEVRSIMEKMGAI